MIGRLVRKKKVHLSTRDRDKLYLHYCNGSTTIMLAKQFDISIVTVRTIINKREYTKYANIIEEHSETTEANSSFYVKDNIGLSEEEMIAFPRASENFLDYVVHANEFLHIPQQYRHYPIDLLD